MTVLKQAEIGEKISLAAKAGEKIIPFSQANFPSLSSDTSKKACFIDLADHQEIEEYAPLDQVITVQCGIKMHILEQVLVKNKQWFPVAYWHNETSLLDLILTASAGPLEIVAGGLRRHMLGLSFALSNGQIACAGGRVVKNVSGYDLTRFFIGSWGHFALPIQAHLRLCALPQKTITIMVASNNLDKLFLIARSIVHTGISISYLDIVDRRLISHNQSIVSIKSFLAQSNDNFCLFLQVCGDTSVVDDGIQQVKGLLKHAQLNYEPAYEADEQQNILSFLTQLGDVLNRENTDRILEVALSAPEFMHLSQDKNLVSFPFIYRPAANRLIYRLSNKQEQDSLLIKLNEYAKQNEKSFLVAFADDSYIWRVKNIADTTNNEGEKQAIKQRLKQQFDPDNVFNPFVDL